MRFAVFPIAVRHAYSPSFQPTTKASIFGCVNIKSWVTLHLGFTTENALKQSSWSRMPGNLML
uniref:Uncharacterized protein n=1 Tax=Anguilla anguilla TaxID=7936 RepID=A0A0E9WZL1_ANGAN